MDWSHTKKTWWRNTKGRLYNGILREAMFLAIDRKKWKEFIDNLRS
jgi:hypothetical protein